MVAPLKSRPSWATAAVPPAANIARPETRSRRLSEPLSKRVKRLAMIDSMAMSFRSKDGLGSKIIARRAEERSAFHALGGRTDCHAGRGMAVFVLPSHGTARNLSGGLDG